MIDDDSDFVKEQIDFHRRLARSGKDEFARRRHEQLASRFELLLKRLQRTPETQSQQPSEIDEAEEDLGTTTGSDLPRRAKLRLGDTTDLPAELLEQLSQGRRDELEQTILEVINRKFGGAAAIDEIMVEVWRETKNVVERQFLSTKLYRMTRKEVLFPVPKRKGVYSTTPVAA